MPNNEKDYGFGRTTVEGNDGWYPTKQKPTTSNLYPYNHIDDLINEKLEQHLKRTDNPHQVTLQQLGVDHLFTHNIRVEYDEVKPELHLILLDLNGNDLKDVGPIDIDLSKYSDEQLEELKKYLEDKIYNLSQEVNQRIDQEIQDRSDEDALLQNQIDTLDTDLRSEVETRSAKDIELETSIGNLDDKLNTEINDRTNADTTLDNKIDNLTIEDITDDRISVNNNIEFKNSESNKVAEVTNDNIVVNNYFKVAPELYLIDDETVNITLHNEQEYVLTSNVLNVNFTFDNTVKHGYCVSISFDTANRVPHINFNNNPEVTGYNLKVIFQNAIIPISELVYSSNCEYNFIIICNGLNLELYVQEIEL